MERIKNLRVFILLMVLSAFLFAAAASNAAPKKEELVTFNFVDVDISTITKFISEVTGKNFIFDERVRGKITIIAPSKLNVSDSFSLFTSVLELKGFTVVPAGVGVYKIVPSAEAKHKGISIQSGMQPVNASYIARLVQVVNISSDDALKLLQPLISRDGYIAVFGPGNLLLVIDSGLNIEKVIALLETVDQPLLREPPEMVFLKHAAADAVVKVINEGMLGRGKAKGQPDQPGKPGTPGYKEDVKIVADNRLNAVVLFGDRDVRGFIKSLIELVDVPAPATPQGRINVYFLENADATELVKVLEGIIRVGKPGKQPVEGQASAAVFETGSGISVNADKSTNSLIVVSSPADYQNLVQVISQLDRRRKQVYVEAMILEASIDNLRQLGSKWRAIGQSGGSPVAIGGFGTVDSSAVQNIISGLEGVTVGGMGNFMDIPLTSINAATGGVSTATLNVPGFAALFSLSDFKDVVNVLSTPQILTSDNKEAEIVVGENVPFISKREREAAAGTVLSSIERKDVGITLRITPQISEGGYVRLDVYQEISSVKEPPAGLTEAILTGVGPTTTKRSTKTSVTVKDSQTVVIGGLMQEKDEENITKVPLLGDIPFIGWLFKHKSVDKKKTNLLVFITPHVVRDADALTGITRGKETGFARAEGRYTEGVVIIRFKDGITDEAARVIIKDEDAAVLDYNGEQRLYKVRLEKGGDVEDMVKEFQKHNEVESSEPEYRLR
ncbi:MAG: type II secretion system secretin GspD [Deltaproteobacteria bacterium]|nr:type II secretion system secretin GspD [Deltaproteobacteria bacterium]